MTLIMNRNSLPRQHFSFLDSNVMNLDEIIFLQARNFMNKITMDVLFQIQDAYSVCLTLL